MSNAPSTGQQGRPGGLKSAYAKFGPSFAGLLELRARAAIAAALAETSLVPHPWTQSAFDRLVEGITKAASLYAQVNALPLAKDGKPPQPPSSLSALLYVELNYGHGAETLPWGNAALNAKAKDNRRISVPVEAAVLRDRSTSDIGDMTLSVLFDEDVPLDAIRLIRKELQFQLQVAPGLALALKPRHDWRSRSPRDRGEVLWDLRVRMAMFVGLFLQRYRSDEVQFFDPFLVFFLAPRRIGRADGAGRPSHFRTGLMGYSYIIDGGQRQHLEDEGIDIGPAMSEDELGLPFADGLCGAVYLAGTAQKPELAERVLHNYVEVLPAVRAVEEKMLQSRLLLELPIHVADLEALTPDGPELIVTLAVPRPEGAPAPPPHGTAAAVGTKSQEEHEVAAGAQDISEEAATAEQLRARIEGLMASPMPEVFAPGEIQVLQEVTRRLVSEFVRAPNSALVDTDMLLGRSHRMQKVARDAMRLARGNDPILILGPPGAGKTVLAGQIHNWSDRSRETMVEVSAASLSPELAASELFGYREGSHNMASEDRAGIIEGAEETTLFIDDFDALPRDVQAMLLGVMEGRDFRRVGDERPTQMSTARFILATNSSIDDLVANGMRPDFLTRLGGCVRVPPLDERRDDIPDLVHHFLRRHTEGVMIDIDPPVLEFLQAFDWSDGEVRALRGVVRRACNMVLAEASSGATHAPASKPKQPEMPTLRVMQPHVNWALAVRPPSAVRSDTAPENELSWPNASEINANAAALGAGFEYRSFADAHCTLDEAFGQIRDYCLDWIDARDHSVAFTSSATAACEAGLFAISAGADLMVHTDLAHPNIADAIRGVAGILSKARGSPVGVVEVPVRALLDATPAAADFAKSVADALLRAVGDRRAAIIIEHVAFEEGIRLPIDDICDRLLAARADLQILIDGAQAIGVWKPARALRAHYLGCFHKFIAAPPGTAFVALGDGADLDCLPHSLACTVKLDRRADFPTTDIVKWQATARIIKRLSGDAGAAQTIATRVEEFMADLERALLPHRGTLADIADPSLRSHILAVDAGGADVAHHTADQMVRSGIRVQAMNHLVRISMGAKSRRGDAHAVGAHLSFMLQAGDRLSYG